MSVTFQDTYLATPPIATVVATDQVAGEEFQRMKIVIGDVGVDDGNISSLNPMPVNFPIPPVVTVSGTVPVTLPLESQKDMRGVVLYGPDGLPLRQEVDSRELLTIDENLRNVFGTTSLITGHGQIKVDPQPIDKMVVGRMRAANESVVIELDGHASVVVSLTGNWSGTIYAYVLQDQQNWTYATCQIDYANNVVAVGNFIQSNGMMRANVSGMKMFRITWGAYTSGICYVKITASRNPIAFSQVTVGGSATRAFPQKQISPYELVTMDAHESPQNEAVKVAPLQPHATWTSTTPTLPTTYVSRAFSNWPQYFARVRTEVAGSERLPLAQESGTNKLMTSDEQGRRLLEQILQQLIVISNLLYEQIDHNGAPGFNVPAGFVELTKNNLSS